MSISANKDAYSCQTAVAAAISEDQESPLARAVEEYLAALESGQPLDRAELLARHPEIAEDLGKCLEGLDWCTALAHN